MLKKLLSYSSSLLVSNLFSGGLSFVVTLLAARILSKGDFGVCSHYVLIYATISTLFLSGTQQSLISFINSNPEKNEDLFVGLLNTMAMLIFLFLCVLILLFRHNMRVETILAIFIVVPNIYTMLVSLVYRANLAIKKEIYIRVGISLLNSGLSLVLLYLYKSRYSIITADMFSLLIPTIILLIVFSSGRKFVFVSPFNRDVRIFWNKTLPLWIAGILFFINTQIQMLSVDLFLGVEELAVFSFVITFWTLIQRPLEMVQRATLPVLTKTKDWKGDESVVINICIVLFPMLGLTICASYNYLLVLFGYDQYLGTEKYLILLCSSLPIVSIEFIFSAMSVAVGKNKVNRDVMVICFLVATPFSIFLIWHLGVLGAFLSLAGYNYLYGIMLIVMLRNIFRIQMVVSLKLLGRCLAIFLPCLVFVYANYNNIYYAIAGPLIFVIGCWIVGLLNFSYLFSLIKNRFFPDSCG